MDHHANAAPAGSPPELPASFPAPRRRKARGALRADPGGALAVVELMRGGSFWAERSAAVQPDADLDEARGPARTDCELCGRRVVIHARAGIPRHRIAPGHEWCALAGKRTPTDAELAARHDHGTP